jgi:aminoglycoside phosphotransferase (APT) family kinase protein
VTLHEALTPEHACQALAELGFRLSPADVHLVPRDGRWLVRLPGGRLAWFAATAAGLAAMQTERRVLRVLKERCGFAAPRVLAASADGGVDVRAMVPGVHDTRAVYARVRREPEAARRVGAALGAILADLHTRAGAADVAGWLPRRPGWPEPRGWICDRLPRVVDHRGLRAEADAVIAEYEELLDRTPPDDRVLVHADLGLHNVSVDAATLRVHGVFDWESACWADRHLDFRYLVFDTAHDALLEAALAVYEPAAGRPVSRERVLLYNAACAVCYLAFRAGVPPEQSWCGRTLAEDLHWTRHAIARLRAARRS